MTRIAVLACALLLAGPAWAHKPSDSYLRLTVDGAAIEGQWDIALRDLDAAIGLDADGDGTLTWGEVRARHAAIAAYAQSRLTLGRPEAPCAVAVREHLIDRHTDGAYAVLRFAAACAETPRALAIDYRLLFDIDPRHRGLVSVTADGATRAAILSADAPAQRLSLAASPAAQFAAYFGEGVLHIFLGLDHVLFLLSLLLPAVLVRAPGGGGGWVGAPSFRHAFLDVFRIVTAFTVAHSITLTLAALGVVSLPSRWVESAIAASVVLAALNNVRPVVVNGRWALAFAFGLVHGFGFASVLADLGLPRDSLAAALLAFNLGVEAGQLAIVAAFLPIAYAVRGTRFYARSVVVGGSLAVAALAGVWFAERALDVGLLPAVEARS